jgi:hypothetical protein
VDKDVTPEPMQILGCRSPAFADRLAQGQHAALVLEATPPDSEMLCGLLTDFWINSHKHRKLLHRGLEVLCVRRLHKERDLLVRLWYVQSTGKDYPQMRESLHSLAEIVATVRHSMDSQALFMLGAPTRNRQELLQVIEWHREVVSALGHRLAQQHDFPLSCGT